MFKCIAFLRKKNGLSNDAFVEYYETHHAPLIRSLLPQIIEYRRNFLDAREAFLSAGATPVDFDVVTEMWFDDRTAYDSFIARAAEPDIAARIASDEEHLFDRTKVRMMIVEERVSQ